MIEGTKVKSKAIHFQCKTHYRKYRNVLYRHGIFNYPLSFLPKLQKTEVTEMKSCRYFGYLEILPSTNPNA